MMVMRNVVSSNVAPDACVYLQWRLHEINIEKKDRRLFLTNFFMQHVSFYLFSTRTSNGIRVEE